MSTRKRRRLNGGDAEDDGEELDELPDDDITDEATDSESADDHDEEDEEDDDSDEGDSDDPVDEWDDDLMGDEEDRAKLQSMSEVAREDELFQRAEKRKAALSRRAAARQLSKERSRPSLLSPRSKPKKRGKKESKRRKDQKDRSQQQKQKEKGSSNRQTRSSRRPEGADDDDEDSEVERMRRSGAMPSAIREKQAVSRALEDIRRKRELSRAIGDTPTRKQRKQKSHKRGHSDKDDDDDSNQDEEDDEDDEEDEDGEHGRGHLASSSQKRSPTFGASAAAGASSRLVSPPKILNENLLQPVRLQDVKGCQLRRQALEHICNEPYFERFIKDKFVRVSVGLRQDNTAAYRLCVVDGVQVLQQKEGQSRPPTYAFGPNKAETRGLLLRHGKAVRLFPMNLISNSGITEPEFQRWKQELERCGLQLPGIWEVQELRKQAEHERRTFVYDDSVVAKMLRQEQAMRGGRVHRNAAMERSRLELERQRLQSLGEAGRIELQQVEQQLQQLLDVEERRRRQESNDVMQQINQRNALMNQQVMEQLAADALQEQERAAFDPEYAKMLENRDVFTRRQTRPAPIWSKRRSGDQEDKEQLPKEAASSDIQKHAAEGQAQSQQARVDDMDMLDDDEVLVPVAGTAPSSRLPWLNDVGNPAQELLVRLQQLYGSSARIDPNLGVGGAAFTRPAEIAPYRKPQQRFQSPISVADYYSRRDM